MSQEAIWSDAVHAHVLLYAATGSRVICRPPPSGTDYDVLVLAKDMDLFHAAAMQDGWDTSDGSGDGYAEVPDFISYRRGEVNLIVTNDQQFYQRFDAATHIAARLNLLQKSDRIALFQAVLYGNKWAEQQVVA